jgi:2-polyprenyl-3-methyl-5-hydroxy-6-metoxy-1,4-benzoquinol methylase
MPPEAPDLNQKSNATKYDRYPRIFSHVAALKPDSDDLKILSYGCSHGVEIKSLRNLYFPKAQIDGIDIVKEIINENRKKNNDAKTSYFHAEDPGIGHYDVIFGMSLLCRYPASDGPYPFERFDSLLSKIDERLLPGGILALYNVQYLLEESSIAARYSPCLAKDLHVNYRNLEVNNVIVPRYWKDQQLFSGVSPVVFRKVIDRLN